MNKLAFSPVIVKAVVLLTPEAAFAQKAELRDSRLQNPLVSTPESEKKMDSLLAAKVREAALCILTDKALPTIESPWNREDVQMRQVRFTDKNIIYYATVVNDTNNDLLTPDALTITTTADGKSYQRITDHNLNGKVNLGHYGSTQEEAEKSYPPLEFSDIRFSVPQAPVQGKELRAQYQRILKQGVDAILKVCVKNEVAKSSERLRIIKRGSSGRGR